MGDHIIFEIYLGAKRTTVYFVSALKHNDAMRFSPGDLAHVQRGWGRERWAVASLCVGDILGVAQQCHNSG